MLGSGTIILGLVYHYTHHAILAGIALILCITLSSWGYMAVDEFVDRVATAVERRERERRHREAFERQVRARVTARERQQEFERRRREEYERQVRAHTGTKLRH